MLLIPDDQTGALKPLKWYRKLATGKGRREAGAFLIEGERAIRQVISNNPGEIIEILATETLPVSNGNYSCRLITESQLHAISATRTPQGTIAVVRLPRDTYSDRLPASPGARILLLEDVQDPGNVGTLIRTAVAFGFSGVILTGKGADPLSPKCVQSTAGTVLALWLRRTSRYLEPVTALKNSGYSLVAADLTGTADLSVLPRQDRLLLALGNEASGLSESLREMSDYRLRVPTVPGKAESLNVAVCGAICMYLANHQ